MNKKIYLGLMILPMYLANSPLGLASSNLLLFPQIQHQAISPNTLVANTNFQLKFKNIPARDDQTEDCLRSGICKD